MTWLKRALPAFAILVLSAVPAIAQVTGQPFEFSGAAGLFNFDTRARVKDGVAYKGSVGWRPFSWLSLEGTALLGPSKADTVPRQKNNFSYFGLDVRWNLRHAEDRAVPFVVTGLGYAASNTSGHVPDKLQRGSGSLGLGLLLNILNPRTYVRLEARDVWFRDRDALEFSNDLAVTAGLHYVLGGRYKDQDLDKVRDWLDKCPDTPIGCIVDANGCPSDADGDSVCDGVDKCPNTPKGCKVDATGCPIDSDGDGVCDGIDACPDTPKGATVDAKGCPSDSDGDGVPDGIDKCAGTPKGCAVDSVGCTQDSDGDGICDTLDKCPNTPSGVQVGPTGCPVEIGAFERALLDSGVARVKGIAFTTEYGPLTPASTAVMDSVGRVLQQYPGLKIEIGGPTDVKGKQAEKERLSLDQDRVLIDYFKSKFPLITTGLYTMRGYKAAEGGVVSAPSAKPTSRRIEFRVMNPDVLPAEREKRGLGK